MLLGSLVGAAALQGAMLQVASRPSLARAHVTRTATPQLSSWLNQNYEAERNPHWPAPPPEQPDASAAQPPADDIDVSAAAADILARQEQPPPPTPAATPVVLPAVPPPPPIDDERQSRSPGLQKNFYDVPTSEFKRPHGSQSGAATPETGPTPPAGAAPGYGVETPLPGREKEYEAVRGAVSSPRSGLQQNVYDAPSSAAPPIDEERRQRSPGMVRNFYETPTADFKRPHGMRATEAVAQPPPVEPPAAAASQMSASQIATPATMEEMARHTAPPAPEPDEPLRGPRARMAARAAAAQQAEAPAAAEAAAEAPTSAAQPMPAAATRAVDTVSSSNPAAAAMQKILDTCKARSQHRAACEAAAPPPPSGAKDMGWRDMEEQELCKARDELEASKVSLVKATQALRDSTAASSNLLDLVDDDMTSYRQRKERWNAEVDKLARKVEDAAKGEEKYRATVEKLEGAKARASAAIARDAAIKSEAVALALKEKLLTAIDAIEQMDA